MITLYRSAGTPKSRYLFCCQLKSSVEEGNLTKNPRDQTRAIVQNGIRKITIFAALSLLSNILVLLRSLFLIQQGDRRDMLCFCFWARYRCQWIQTFSFSPLFLAGIWLCHRVDLINTVEWLPQAQINHNHDPDNGYWMKKSKVLKRSIGSKIWT